MAFNVTDIIQSVNTHGVLKPSKFEVIISGNDTLTVRCIAAQIPGLTINTTDFKLYGGMPVLKVPTSKTYTDLRLTFLARSDSKDRYFFENWFNRISNFSSNTVAYGVDVPRLKIFPGKLPNGNLIATLIFPPLKVLGGKILSVYAH